MLIHVNVGFLRFENKGMGCDELRMAKPAKRKINKEYEAFIYQKLDSL